MNWLFIALIYVSWGASSIKAEEKRVYDKSQYNLFCPVPDDKLKDMSADRPDKTEGPFTVDPGHYQVEFDMVTYTLDKNKKENTRSRNYTVFSPNFRIGLTERLEFDIIMTALNSVRTKDIQTRERTYNQGFDDTVLRLKYNLWGNEDNLPNALGVIPFVKIPTNQDQLGNKSYEGGVLLPYDIKLGENLGLGLMTGVEYNKGERLAKHTFNFINSASFSCDLTEKWGVFMEIYTERSNERVSRWIATFDVGGSYALADNWQFDAGIYTGLTPEADNITPFIGMSIRF